MWPSVYKAPHKMPSAWRFPPHTVFLGTGIFACELSSEFIMQNMIHDSD